MNQANYNRPQHPGGNVITAPKPDPDRVAPIEREVHELQSQANLLLGRVRSLGERLSCIRTPQAAQNGAAAERLGDAAYGASDFCRGVATARATLREVDAAIDFICDTLEV